MIRRAVLTACLLTAASIFGGSLFAADSNPKNEQTFTNPADAGQDYKLQGEYTGAAGDQKWGAQVIAMGDGAFHAVFLPGGLPGDGWNAKDRYESKGKLEGDKVAFTPATEPAWADGHIPPPVEEKKGFEATLTGDTLTGKTDDGKEFSLKKVVRHSSTEGLKPAPGAIVLFDGSSAENFKNTRIVDGNLLKEGGTTKQKFTDYTLHVEFYLPFKPFARTQERGNSGVYNQNRYEVQVLDSFGLKGMDNQCGGVYSKNPPMVNMSYPPLTWQTYDIDFTAARYEDGKRKSEAEITVKHNGVLIQEHYKIDGPTWGGEKEDPAENIQSGPIYLQDHNNPVVFRNVWIVEKK